MKKKLTKTLSLLSVTALLCTSLAGCGSSGSNESDSSDSNSSTKKEETKEQAKSEFAPALDTEADVSLEIAGFMANFEALDQVVNDFNEYYPNVSINYEQNGVNDLSDYLANNDYVDIFMTSDGSIRASDNEGMYVLDNCLDLSKEEIDTSAIDPELLEACTVDGKLARIPLAKTMCGMVVNETLLEKEGLNVPQTYEEFLSTCETLKSKGYTPIQSSKIHASSDMILPMAMFIIGNDKALTQKVNDNDTSYADSLKPVYDKLEELIEKGYVSSEVNASYPDDNYDQAILKFFEGDVPFWIANTESVSGMKKRESKSESFSANPFDYKFVDVPLGDDGVYDYEEPWYGFSVNQNSDQIDYAVEFINFLMQEEELNKLAEVKGMPSVTLHNDDERFNDALNPEKLEGRYILNGELNTSVTSPIADAANQLGNGGISTTEEAIEYIKNR